VAKKPKKLEDLFHETLKDIYFAENEILKTLPKMAKAAQFEELRAAYGDVHWLKRSGTFAFNSSSSSN
jgi:ferritin-like metal-binding protein YciE